MAEFYRSRLALSFHFTDPHGSSREVPLITYNKTLLLALPEYNWETPYESHNCLGAPWAFTRATGGAALSLKLSFILPPAPTVAEAETAAHALEFTINLNRDGRAFLRDAYHKGVPASTRWWNATITSFRASLCSADEAPAIIRHTPDGRPAHAYAKADLEIILTQEPQDPQDPSDPGTGTNP